MHAHALPQDGASPSNISPEVLQCLLAAVDKLDLGILLIDRDDRIAFANRAAETLLRPRSGSRRSVQAKQRPIGATLDAQISAQIRARPKITERQITMIKSEGRSLSLLSVSCQASKDGMEIIFICESSSRSPRDLSPISPHYRLTRAETRLLQALVQGDTIVAYAKRAGITHNTAKGYLKELFRKTTTTRQSDLVRLVLGNPILHLISREGAWRRA